MELHKWRGMLDCGDHSCLFTDNRSGQRTNGGCRCVPPGPHSNRLKLVINMLMDNEKRLSENYAALRAELDLALGAHVYVNDEWHRALKRLEAAEKQLSLYRRAVGPVLMDNLETLHYVLKYVERAGLSAENDVLASIEKTEACIRTLGEEAAKG